MNESRQSRGVGSFFFAAIPAVIACALLLLLAFMTGIVEFTHSEDAYKKRQTYEGRREARVGVNGEILKPVDLLFVSNGCVKIERAYLDTQTLTIYIHNTCSAERQFIKWGVREYAPDGTDVQSHGTYLDTPDGNLAAGEKFEQVVQVSNDSRVVKIVVSTNGGRPE